MHVHEKRYSTRAEFFEVLEPVMDGCAVDWMRSQRHHVTLTVFDHSMFVAYVAFLMARHWKHCDPVMAARAGFLHDLYMYDRRDKTAHGGTQCFDHPEYALANASRLFPWLSVREKNAIVAHMFPLARHVPRYSEAWAVTLSDKFCAVLEFFQLHRTRLVKKHKPGSRSALDFSACVGNISA